MNLFSNSDAKARFSRQRGEIPDDVRQNTVIVNLGGEDRPLGCGMVQLGAILTGCGGVVSDFTGVRALDRGDTPLADSEQMLWMHGCRNETELRTVGQSQDLNNDKSTELIDSFARQRIIVACNRPDRSIGQLESIADITPGAETVLYLTTADGFAIQRCATPRDAIRSLDRLSPTIADEPIDLSMVAAGVALGIALFTDRLPELDASGTSRVLTYRQSLEQRRVVTSGWSEAQDVLGGNENSGRASLAGRQVTLVGAGAIGSFAALGLALERLVAETQGGAIDVIDGDDRVETSNLARQPLYTSDNIGEAKAAAAVATLQRIDPRGEYRPTAKYVESADDVPTDRADAILCYPDNDEARLVCARASAESGVPLAVGATGPVSGSVWVQSAGRDDYLRYVEAIDASRRSVRNSCADGDQPSTVVPNLIVGGLMLAEIKTELARTEPRNIRYEAAASIDRTLRATMF